jgi:hypothetical protein
MARNPADGAENPAAGGWQKRRTSPCCGRLSGICRLGIMNSLAMSFGRLSAVFLVVAAVSLLGAGWGRAEPLDKQSCSSLQTERKQLLTKDMQSALDQGPDWVKTHLNEVEIDQVRRFLNIEEQIEFRCRGGGVDKAKVVAPDAEAVPLPDRKPSPPSSTSPATSPSQALADQDKTTPAKTKATR